MGLKLAAIGTFHGRLENTGPLVKRLLIESTRRPDEVWLLGEDDADVCALLLAVLNSEADPRWAQVEKVETPRHNDGRYQVIPYSNKINFALGRTQADAIVYVDNNSMPAKNKFDLMIEALEDNPDWGGVYCGQTRTGMHNIDHPAGDVCHDGFCCLNYTQVMHRSTPDRWPMDTSFAQPQDMADGHFWRTLHERVGPFYPVGKGLILDVHHIENEKAAGL